MESYRGCQQRTVTGRTCQVHLVRRAWKLRSAASWTVSLLVEISWGWSYLGANISPYHDLNDTFSNSDTYFFVSWDYFGAQRTLPTFLNGCHHLSDKFPDAKLSLFWGSEGPFDICETHITTWDIHFLLWKCTFSSHKPVWGPEGPLETHEPDLARAYSTLWKCTTPSEWYIFAFGNALFLSHEPVLRPGVPIWYLGKYFITWMIYFHVGNALFRLMSPFWGQAHITRWKRL